MPAVNQDIRNLGWYFLPVILLSSTLSLAVALVLNNIQRRYPVFWFHPAITISAPVSPDIGGPEIDDRSAGSETPADSENISPKKEISNMA